MLYFKSIFNVILSIIMHILECILCVFIYIYPNFKLPPSVKIIDHFFFLPYIYNFQNLYHGYIVFRVRNTHTYKRKRDWVLPWPAYGLALSFRRLGELLLFVILWKLKHIYITSLKNADLRIFNRLGLDWLSLHLPLQPNVHISDMLTFL